MPLRPQKSMIPLALAGSLIVLAGWAAYSNSFHGPFINDDIRSIPLNPTIRHLWQFGAAISPPGQGLTVGGRPLLNLSFAINYALGGTNVWGYHVTNVVIHLLGGLILLGILRRTFLLPALRPNFGRNSLLLASAIALLWVLHPLQTQAVTYTVQRAESLASLFYLLVLYAVIRGTSSSQPVMWYVVAVVACWLGVATKEIVATAPVVAMVYDRTFLAGTFRQAWRQRWKLYLGLATAWLMVATLTIAMDGRGESAGFGYGMTSWNYAASQGGAILRYVRLALWPTGLCMFYGNPVARTPAEILPGALFVLVLAGLTAWALKRQSGLGFLGFFFLAALAPSSSFVPIVEETLAERRMYLPLAAVITLLVIGAYLVGQKWIARGRLAVGLCLVSLIAVVFGFLTFHRNQVYQSDLSIWEDTAMKTPDQPRNQYYWGSALRKRGRPLEAIEHFQRAVQISPDFAKAHSNWGGALMELGRPLEAIEHFQQAVKIDPDDAETYYHLGNALSKTGQFSEAIQCFQQAARLSPKDAEVYYNLGNAYLAAGQPSDAIPHYKQAIQIAPDYTEAHTNWGIALSMLGRQAEAIEHFQEAVRIQPNDVDTQTNLMKALMQAGRTHEAEKIRMRLQLDKAK